ncbi:MAG: tetratricopeptide repeat protein [Bacteroidales bacterium]|nr:tetratricopeptide repeat protein [Bacteroidales bacterium]
MKKIAFLLMVAMVSMAGMAQGHDWIEEGNAAYNEGNYDQALTCYNSIVEAGMESATLYYNMGNTYYKMKDYPHAILYYEKALKLDPGDEDIRTNLEIANMSVVDKINQIPQSFIKRWWNSLKSSLSADGWAWVSVASFALLLLCLFAFLMSRRTGIRKLGFFLGLVFIVCLAFSVLFAVQGHRDLNRHDEAIIMTPTVNVKSTPSDNSVDLFVLHEGAKVRIIDVMKDRSDPEKEWYKIKIADGKVGFLPAADMQSF